MTACRNSSKKFIKQMTSDLRSSETRKYLKKPHIGWRQMLVASQYIVNMSDSIKTGIISVASKKVDYI